MIEKKQIRKQLEDIRNHISEEVRNTASDQCMERLKELPAYRETKIVYIFLSFRTELNTLPIIEKCLADGKIVAVPKVEGKEMQFYQIHSLTDCEPGAWGILEPLAHCPVITGEGLMLMPGLGFDPDGGRIGYGGGFYDRYLSTHKNICKVGLCFEEQIVDHIEMESHDIRADYILTPNRLIM